MILVFLGAPGSGKGTQAKIISSKLNLKHYSTGDILRTEVDTGSDLGNKLKSILSSGALVSDDLVNDIVQNNLTSIKDSLGCILDGYPRTTDQAKFLESINEEKVIAVYFNITTDLLISRITERYTCKTCGAIYNDSLSPTLVNNVCDKCFGVEFTRRSDDNESSLLKRIQIFEQNKMPLLSYYRDYGNIIEVDASIDVEKVTEVILSGVKKY